MAYIVDGIVIAIILLSIIFSAKKGFVKTVIEVAGFIAALIIAFTFSSPLANITYDKMIEPSLVKTAEQSVESTTQNTVDAFWDAMPKFVTNNSQTLGISKEQLSQKVALSTTDNTAQLTISLSQSVAKPVVCKLLSMLFSTILFVVLLFVVKILAKLINKLFSFSIIGKLNRTLGGVIGFVKGIILAFAFCMLVSLLIGFTKNGIWIFNAQILEQTVIFKALCNLSPFLK